MVHRFEMHDRFLAVAIALVLFLLAMVGMPQRAGAAVSPNLENQVLEIIRNHPEAIVESVQAYQQQQQQELQQNRLAFLERLNSNPEEVIGNSPTIGASNPDVFLVEFSDFQCPFCAQAHQTIAEFMDRHSDRVQLIYKHFPLNAIHPQAENAARAAWAASQQGKFWDYHDRLFNQQDKLGESLYAQLATELELDVAQFTQDRQNADMSIASDRQLANQIGISGTPFFIIFAPGTPQGNGESFSGAITLEEMETILARTLNS